MEPQNVQLISKEGRKKKKKKCGKKTDKIADCFQVYT